MRIGSPGETSLPKKNRRWKVILGGILIFGLFGLAFGFFWLINRSDTPGEAPESESVLSAQIEMPFQVLIPAYLPKTFVREKTQVITDGTGPQGEAMVTLIYQTRRGETLTLFEWLPDEQTISGGQGTYCMCKCTNQQECTPVEMGMTFGSIRVRAKVSAPNIMTSEEARVILDTLGPAVNRQIYSSLKDVPVTYSVEPAVEIPINAAGVQEVTLVVTPNGYSPEHFSVQKDVPVVLTFRQIGQVGCGDELIFQWGDGKSATIDLASSNDSQILEFTPGETGDFRFNCPHYIYRGVMTVQE